ncbi:MAG TPA: radical SAM family heme chaperone HemW [Capsulimonadaceae bacterium]|jgi:oxygen-independent coproporphyrinogen-3 oxidase
MATQGCYVHIPFCARKCAYCDFNSYSGYGDASIARYVAAIEREIRGAVLSEGAVDTVFFGGGTPTAIPAADEARILRAVLETLAVTADAEITTEANPGSSDIVGLAALREAGFNRISFGVQSFDTGLLVTLDRIHSADEAKRAVRAAKGAGFENISIDLMYGLPHQTLAQWADTLDQGLELGVEHLSMYSLIIEEGTGFGTLAAKGKLPLPSDDTATDMFEMARSRAASAGYEQYEIANFAKPGRESQHNTHYWRNDPYYGFGAGAVSYQGNVRMTRLLTPSRYAAAVESNASLIHESESPDTDQQMAETMMLGLRLTREGIHIPSFHAKFGCLPADRWPSEIARLTTNGLLETASDALRLTRRGVFLANEVMVAFI